MPRYFLKLHQVSEKIGLNSVEIYELQESGDFPTDFSVYGHQMFLLHEIEEWMDEQVRQRDLVVYRKRKEKEKDRQSEGKE